MATIEQKAIAYDKAIEKIKYAMDHGVQPVLNKEDLLDIFTELKEKESEDERIRGAIIDHLKDSNLTEWAAWLEKQCNANIFDVPKISIKNAVEVTSRMQYIDDDIKPIAEFIMDYANWNLHKDEWNKPTLTVPLFRVLDALIQKGKPYCVCNQNIEKQGEQKSTDKVEPKFKVGDWIVFNGLSLFIKEVVQGYYRTISVDGIPNSYGWDIDNMARLWTISDAKDGDVLAVTMYPEGTWIGIFKEQNGCTFSTYCFLNTVGTFKRGTYGHGNGKAIHPATKEQSDQLKKAMADAGYTFDFEKKELKEIENEEYDGDDYGIDSLWHAKNILKKTLGKVDGYQTDDGILDHKCAITAVDKLYKQKPVWSLEDTFKVQRICKYLDAAKYYADGAEARECIDWLKSFEERVIPNQKQK